MTPPRPNQHRKDEEDATFEYETIGSYDGSDVYITASSSQVTSKILFKSTSITSQLKDNMTRLQLTTRSHDQGWVTSPNEGAWSWFELSILPNANSTEVQKDKDGLDLSWRSHANRIGKDSYARYFGYEFDQNSKLFHSLQVGNVIAVRLCAQFGGWSTTVNWAELRVKVAQDKSSYILDPEDRTIADIQTFDVVYTCNSTKRVDVTDTDNGPDSRIWLKTPPLDEYLVEHVEEIRLATISCDQGRWVTLSEQVPSESWFEVLLLESADDEEPKVVEGKKAIWKSHENAKAVGDLNIYEGTIFGPDHGLTNGIQTGNVIAVRVCAGKGWENHAESGQLIIVAGSKEIRKDGQLSRFPDDPVTDGGASGPHAVGYGRIYGGDRVPGRNHD